MSHSERVDLRKDRSHMSWVISMKRESALGVVLIAAAMGLSACDRTETQSPPASVSQPVQVHTVQLSAGPITRSITLPAQIIPFQQAILYAKVSGYLKSIAVDKGDKVRVGTVLARIPRALRWLLYMGAFVLVGSTWLFAVDNFAIHAIVTAAKASLIS